MGCSKSCIVVWGSMEQSSGPGGRLKVGEWVDCGFIVSVGICVYLCI